MVLKLSMKRHNNTTKANNSHESAADTYMPRISEKEAQALAQKLQEMMQSCQMAQKKLTKCNDEEECATASLDFTLCMSKILCPLQYGAVTKSLHSGDGDSEETEELYNARVEKALENAAECVGGVNERAAFARRQFPHLFGKQ